MLFFIRLVLAINMNLYIQQSDGAHSDVKSPHQLGCQEVSCHVTVKSSRLVTQSHTAIAAMLPPFRLSGAVLIAIITPLTHPMVNSSMEMLDSVLECQASH